MCTFPSYYTLIVLIEGTAITFFSGSTMVRPSYMTASNYELELIVPVWGMRMLSSCGQHSSQCCVPRPATWFPGPFVGVRNATELGILSISRSKPSFVSLPYTASYGIGPVIRCLRFLQLLAIVLLTPDISYHRPLVWLKSPFSVQFNCSTAPFPCEW